MDLLPTNGWVLLFWICCGWTALLVPVTLLYLWIYIKNRDEAFFLARMSNATIMKMFLMLAAVIHRIYDASIGIGLSTEDPINHVIGFIELYPIFCIYTYKYVT